MRFGFSGFLFGSLLSTGSTGALFGGEIDYKRDIQPIFESHCLSCHGPLKQKGGLRLDTGKLALLGGKHGPLAEPHAPGNSLLLDRVRTTDLEERMPPEGAALPAEDIAILEKWISSGAPVPKDEEGPIDPAKHWSYQKPVKAPLPELPASLAKFSQHPIDALAAAAWQREGLQPQQKADKATLLRRVTLDLTGLLPTVHELSADEPWEATVDRLLASPRFGERWGRHWMDVWRYCDPLLDDSSPAADPLVSENHIWRWRNWIIASLNENKPYSAMVQAMLAADELFPEDSQALAATGFLVRNKNALNGRDALVQDSHEHTAQAFVGMTMKCARCHDHKYDPISQKNYYQWQSFFESMDARVDFVAGESDIKKDGLARIYESNVSASTFLLKNGNPQDPERSEPMLPNVPSMLPASAQPQKAELPLVAWKPSADPQVVASSRKQHAAALKQANEQVEAKQKDLTWARENQAELFKKPMMILLAANDEPLPPDAGISEKASQEELPVQFPQEASLALAEKKAAAAQMGLRVVELCVKADAEGATATQKQQAMQAKRDLERLEEEVKVAFALEELAVRYHEVLAKKKEPKDLKNRRQRYHTAKQKLNELAEKHAKPLPDYESLWKTYSKEKSGRRTALAQWITAPENPLAARVAVNHIWLRHFGAPLVETVFDFGLRGRKPVNQPLLDWLAADFVEHGWDLKRLHRQILTSRIYRLSSARLPGSANEQKDVDNVHLWRMNPRRMEGEIIRDSILGLSGKLDLRVVQSPLPSDQIDKDFARSVYFAHSIENRPKLIDLFDGADPNEAYRRVLSVVPQQALVLANSPFVQQQAKIIAERLSPEKEDAKFVEAVVLSLLGRQPKAGELQKGLQFLENKTESRRAELVQAFLNHSDFITLR
jgi:hypothetical protein